MSASTQWTYVPGTWLILSVTRQTKEGTVSEARGNHHEQDVGDGLFVGL
jgi:hypothetical protein